MTEQPTKETSESLALAELERRAQMNSMQLRRADRSPSNKIIVTQLKMCVMEVSLYLGPWCARSSAVCASPSSSSSAGHSTYTSGSCERGKKYYK